MLPEDRGPRRAMICMCPVSSGHPEGRHWSLRFVGSWIQLYGAAPGILAPFKWHR